MADGPEHHDIDDRFTRQVRPHVLGVTDLRHRRGELIIEATYTLPARRRSYGRDSG
jgi:hypothetical protein